MKNTACDLKAGESLDAVEFSQRFPSLSRSLYFFITVHSMLDNDPDYAAFQSSVAWPEPGSHFLGFDLICEIGRGAMGRVFLASERALGERPVVLKVALQDGHEADILGRLRHANIVPVYSIQEDAATGLTAFCMPYLGQATLAAVLDGVYADRRPPLRARAILDAVRAANQGADLPESPPPDRILRGGSYVEGVIHLGVQLAEALAHAHGNGIFHRDLKPSNILMSPEGGRCCWISTSPWTIVIPIWRIGGTLPYMAPEELSGLCAARPRHCAALRPPQRLVLPGRDPLRVAHRRVCPSATIPCDRPVEEIAARLRQRQAKGPRPLREHNQQVDKRLAGLIEQLPGVRPGTSPGKGRRLGCRLAQGIDTLPPHAAVGWLPIAGWCCRGLRSRC